MDKDNNIGRVIGDFKIIREIGSGGMGTVYEAIQLSSNRRVALKLLLPSFTHNEKDVKRFQREIDVIAKLDHPNIVTIYTAGEEEDEHFYAMKYIDGPSLDKMIKYLTFRGGSDNLTVTVRDIDGSAVTVKDIINERASSDNGAQSAVRDAQQEEAQNECDEDLVKMPESAEKLFELYEGGDKELWAREIAKLFVPVAEALHYAHSKNIIHRDMKPGNLLLDPSGKLIITDFGLAKVIDAESLKTLTDMGTVVGTVMYMSPEQIAGGRIKLNHKIDIYSLGVTLYEILTLKTPFPSDLLREELFYKKVFETPPPPRKVDPSVPKVLSEIIQKAMHREPHYRYESAEELADHLRAFSEGKKVRVESSMKRSSRWLANAVKKGKSIAAAVIICLTALLISFLAYKYAVIYEINKKLRTAHELMEKGEYQRALEVVLYLTAKYPEKHPHIDDAFVMVGICHDRLGEREKAIQAFLTAYSVVKSEKSRAETLYHLGEHFSDASDFHPDFGKACNLYRKLLARYPESEVSAKARLRLGEVFMNVQRVDEARKYLEAAANDDSLSAEDRQRAQDDSDFLKKLFPSMCRLNFRQSRFGDIYTAEIGDIDSDGKSELVVGGEKGLTIIEVEDGALNASLHFPISERANEICIGDTDGDGKAEIIAAQENPDKDLDGNNLIRIYKQANGTLDEIWRDETGSGILNNCIAIGDTDDDEENEIAAGMHDYGRDSRLYDKVGTDKYIKILLSPDLQPSNTGGVTTNTHAVTISDVDGDGKNETIMGTGPFHGYDVRVVKFNPNVGNYELAWRKKMGNILALGVGDVDGDGINEIAAAKSFTFKDSANLGESAPHGEPNGLYIFKSQKGHKDYARIWSDLIDKEKCDKPECRQIIVNDFDGDGRSELIALWHTLGEPTCWLDIYSSAKSGSNEEPELNKRRIFYAPSAKILKAGDIDDDGGTELIVISQDYLDIYGLDAELEKELASMKTELPILRDIQKEVTPLTIAEDIRGMGFLEYASKAFERVAKGEFPDDISIAAWTAAIDCLIEEGNYDGALKLLDQFQKVYPAEVKQIAFKKLGILEKTWSWREAYLLLEKMGGMPGLSSKKKKRIENDRKWVALLTVPQTNRIFSEDFANELTGHWKITNPQKFCVTPEKELHILQSRLSGDFVRVYVPWRGGSFRLRFDIKIEEVEWNSDTAFGIIRETKEDARTRPDLVKVAFGCHGGGNPAKGEGVFYYNVESEVSTKETLSDDSGNHAKSFTEGTRYRIELTYIKQRGEIRTIVRDINMNKEMVTLSMSGDIDFEQGNYYLGSIPTVRNTLVSDNWSGFTIDNIELFNLDPDYVVPTERPSEIKNSKLEIRNSQALMLRANLNAISGKLDQAIRDYTRIIELGNDPMHAYYFRGLCYKDKGDLLLAFRDYDKALELADDLRCLMEVPGETLEEVPRSYALDGKLAREYFSDRDYSEMLNISSRRIDGAKGRATAEDYFARGLIYYYRGDYRNALRDLSRAVALDETNCEYFLRLGRCCLNMRNIAGAAEYFDIARKLEPSDPRVYYANGLLNQTQGRYTDAIRDLTKAIELKRSFIHFKSRAECLMSRGNMTAGISDLQQAISLTKYTPLKGFLTDRMLKVNR